MPKAVLQSFTTEISVRLGDGSRLATLRLMCILTLAAREIIMTKPAFLCGKESGSLHSNAIGKPQPKTVVTHCHYFNDIPVHSPTLTSTAHSSWAHYVKHPNQNFVKGTNRRHPRIFSHTLVRVQYHRG